jgi:hypothetical protein
LTFVGEVPQGTLNVDVPLNYGSIGSAVPQSLGLDNPSMNFPATDGMKYFKWLPGTQLFDLEVEYFSGATPPGWYQGETQVSPTPAVGEAFFLLNGSGTAATWTRTFSVN